MFRQLATFIPVLEIFRKHPADLARLLENGWNHRRRDTRFALGHPDNRSNLDSLPDLLPEVTIDPREGGEISPPVRWDHLVYAYMIENTRVIDIFRRVVLELVHGEKLGTPIIDATGWLRNTEELFFKPGAPFLIGSVDSEVRPDKRAIARNAYKRMFDMELNHGTEEGKPYPYVKADAVNSEFVSTFEELLREVWIGITYVTATASSNPTDDAKIALLATKLFDMMRSRRETGNLSREEFSVVAATSWFHLTLEFDTAPIITTLRAEASGTEQRLFRVAERVGLPAHGLSKHFFTISDPISRILTQIEFGDFNTADAAPALYTKPTTPTTADTPEAAMRQIIADWAAITGHDVKSRKVTPS
jgi:hypothetical protein